MGSYYCANPKGLSRKRIQLRLTIPVDQREVASSLLWELDTEGFEELESEGRLLIEAYFLPSCSPQALLQRVQKAAKSDLTLHALEATAVQFDPDDWLVNVRRQFKGFAVPPGLYIHPPWEPPSKTHPINLLIEPSHAFGTGTHESTRLCLELLAETAPEAHRMLDVGTGSGILSVAAARLNPDLRIVALDNDPLALEAARVTVRTNQVRKVLLLAGEPEAVTGRFDLVVANLTLEIFRRTAGAISRRASRTLILSGITEDQEDSALHLFAAHRHFQTVSRRTLNGWVCLELRR